MLKDLVRVGNGIIGIGEIESTYFHNCVSRYLYIIRSLYLYIATVWVRVGEVQVMGIPYLEEFMHHLSLEP